MNQDTSMGVAQGITSDFSKITNELINLLIKPLVKQFHERTKNFTCINHHGKWSSAMNLIDPSEISTGTEALNNHH